MKKEEFAKKLTAKGNGKKSQKGYQSLNRASGKNMGDKMTLGKNENPRA